jgi:hypothetical protein
VSHLAEEGEIKAHHEAQVLNEGHLKTTQNKTQGEKSHHFHDFQAFQL